MPSEFSNSEETDTDTDMHTIPSDGTGTDTDEREPSAFRQMTFRKCCGSAEGGLPIVNPNICRRSSSTNTKQSQFIQSFHFAAGVVSFSWLVYFLWNYMFPDIPDPDVPDINTDSLLHQFSQLPTHTYLLVSSLITIISTALITAASMGVLKLWGEEPPPEVYRLETFPKVYTSADPAQHELTHAEILQEFNHNSMRPQTPYNYTLDSKPITDARNVHKNTESGMNFLDGFYLQRIRKFKKTLQEQQEMLDRIRTKHQGLGLDEKDIPQYMLCSPCYDPYNCTRIHFDYNGFRYHCQPHEEDFGETRQKMSKVKIYKDNALGKPFPEDKNQKDMSAPNDFPGRNLQSLLTNKFPPFSNDFDMGKPQAKKYGLKLAPPNPFRKACPRQDPCIYCRALQPRNGATCEHPTMPHANNDRTDCNGNVAYPPRNNSATPCSDEAAQASAPQAERKAVGAGPGPNVLYVNYNFDYK